MSKTTAEKIADKDEQIRQILNEKKQLIQKQKQQDRKDRTKRLCSRHGLLESMLPELITITDEQYKTFLEKAVCNNYGRDILAKVIAQTANNSTSNPPAGATPNTANNTPNTTQIATPSNATLSAKADGGATVEG